jgi:hypothetical protein
MKEKLINILKEHEGKELCYYVCTEDGLEIGTEDLGKMSFVDTSDSVDIKFETMDLTIHFDQLELVEDEDEHEEGMPESIFSIYLKSTTLHFYD